MFNLFDSHDDVMNYAMILVMLHIVIIKTLTFISFLFKTR